MKEKRGETFMVCKYLKSLPAGLKYNISLQIGDKVFDYTGKERPDLVNEQSNFIDAVGCFDEKNQCPKAKIRHRVTPHCWEVSASSRRRD